jgi:hypothetical protein
MARKQYNAKALASPSKCFIFMKYIFNRPDENSSSGFKTEDVELERCVSFAISQTSLLMALLDKLQQLNLQHRCYPCCYLLYCEKLLA